MYVCSKASGPESLTLAAVTVSSRAWSREDRNLTSSLGDSDAGGREVGEVHMSSVRITRWPSGDDI